MSQSSDPAFGVKCFTVAGRLENRRQRCLGVTDEERRWRAQWLKDQVLSPEEPRNVPEYYKATTNIFRRLWKTPFNALEEKLRSSLGHDAAFIVRHGLGKGILFTGITYAIVYYLKYHGNDFAKNQSAEVYIPRTIMYPDHPDYPNFPVKKPSDYYDQGFYSSVLAKKV